jgi:tetratricopeptide (TPR) repeat protein
MLKIENSLTQAQEEENNSPINYNQIKDLYRRVLELDPKNSRALEGMERLVDGMLDQAETALRTGDLDRSREFLQRTAAIEPDNKRLSSVQLAYDTRSSQLEEQGQSEQPEQQSGEPVEIETPEPTGQAQQSLVETESEQAPDAIDQAVQSLEGAIIIEEVTAEEIAQLKRNESMDKGIGAYYNGDYNSSFELLYPLAEDGYARAQFRIGVMYRYGRSVSKNPDLSEKWFTAALPSILKFAQKGVPWAQTDLGTAYEVGISLKQDYERAAHWYRLAADQNYAGAQTNLGVLYANGEGVDYSRSEAVYWLRKAANQGDLVAIENLKIMGVTL